MEFCQTEYRAADQEYETRREKTGKGEERLEQVLCSRRGFFCAYEFIVSAKAVA